MDAGVASSSSQNGMSPYPPPGMRTLLPVSCIVGPGVAVAGSTRVSSLASTHHCDTAVDGDLSTPGSLREDSREQRECECPGTVRGWETGAGLPEWVAGPASSFTHVTAKAVLTARAGRAPGTRSTCGAAGLASWLLCVLDTGLVPCGPAFSPEGMSPSSLVRERWREPRGPGFSVPCGERLFCAGQVTHLP